MLLIFSKITHFKLNSGLTLKVDDDTIEQGIVDIKGSCKLYRRRLTKVEYLYCRNDNFEDFASGKVLYGGGGIPNFPVRLLIEIYCRAKNYLKKKNVALLTAAGISNRKDEIQQLYDKYGKDSHKEASHSCDRLKNMFSHDISAEIFEADCTKTLPYILPNIIITDVPYGNLVEWDNGESASLDLMLEQLWKISHENTILAICMNKKQKINCNKWERLERQNVGKRKFEILRRATLGQGNDIVRG